uniref:SAM domain-containing protein n=1 Tax=Taeniopygia guttata TaxID=59729 RepID=A0A674HJL8_TAEGU
QSSSTPKSQIDPRLQKSGIVKITSPTALWKQQDICGWRKKHSPNKYSLYSEKFQYHDDTGEATPRMLDKNLKRLGVASKSCREHILQAKKWLEITEETKNMIIITQNPVERSP